MSRTRLFSYFGRIRRASSCHLSFESNCGNLLFQTIVSALSLSLLCIYNLLSCLCFSLYNLLHSRALATHPNIISIDAWWDTHGQCEAAYWGQTLDNNRLGTFTERYLQEISSTLNCKLASAIAVCISPNQIKASSNTALHCWAAAEVLLWSFHTLDFPRASKYNQYGVGANTP